MAKIVVLGSAGRLGQMLRAAPLPGAIWHSRGGPADLVWDMEAEPPPPLILPQGSVVLCLAGVTRGDAAAMARNGAHAQAALRAARQWGAGALLLASSVAVYGRGQVGRPSRETDAVAPISAYGAAKAQMEAEMLQAAQDFPVTALRIANVIGADALIGGNAGRAGPVVLDPVPGQPEGPRRSCIGPLGLARVLGGLCDPQVAPHLPKVLNIAAPGAVGMADLLQAADMDWRFGPDNPAVLPRAEVDTARLEALLPGAAGRGTAGDLIAEWRAVAGGRA